MLWEDQEYQLNYKLKDSPDKMLWEGLELKLKLPLKELQIKQLLEDQESKHKLLLRVLWEDQELKLKLKHQDTEDCIIPISDDNEEMISVDNISDKFNIFSLTIYT